jgi:hypothetical protein
MSTVRCCCCCSWTGKAGIARGGPEVGVVIELEDLCDFKDAVGIAVRCGTRSRSSDSGV